MLVTRYQTEFDNCLNLVESYQFKFLFIQAFKRKLAWSHVILMNSNREENKEQSQAY